MLPAARSSLCRRPTAANITVVLVRCCCSLSPLLTRRLTAAHFRGAQQETQEEVRPRPSIDDLRSSMFWLSSVK